MKTATLVTLAVAMLGTLAGCATAPATQGEAATESGYFLSMGQKGQLIGKGQIKDEAGNWYDVWVVPGYVQPAQRSGKYLKRAGRDFGEYFGSEKYRDLAKYSGDALDWAWEDCFVDFTVKGVPRAWGRYMDAAETRTSQRVFGWWLAYPWAILEGTVDTAVRVPLGLTGTALGTAWGIAVVPAYHATDSAVVGTWHLGADALLFPAVATTWNTVISPPMALVGQKPAPARADGFWLKQLKAPSVPAPPVTPEEVAAVAAWGRLLLDANQPYATQREALEKEFQVARDAYYKAIREVEKAQQASLLNTATDPANQAALDYLRSHGLGPARIDKAASAVRQYLGENQGLSAAEINQVLHLLFRYPPVHNTHSPATRPKTDPLERSIEVIKDVP